MPKRICNYTGCNQIIAYTETRCEKHKHLLKQDTRNRYKRYDLARQDDKEYKFYKSKEWEIARTYAMNEYKGIDLYLFFTENRIVPADTVHHIVEIREDWDLRLVVTNLFPLSSSTHNIIHGLYDSGKKKVTQELLRNLLTRWNEIYGVGGIKKS